MKAARLTDVSTGHGCFPGRTNSGASQDVIINDLGAHRLGDPWNEHSCSGKTHGGTLAGASQDVIINDLGAGRVGDPISCGDSVASGSPDVFIN